MTPRRGSRGWLKKARATILRWTSVLAGIYIEHRQVDSPHAQTILVVLGMWLILVPPAQALDSLGRIDQAAKILTGRNGESEATRRRKGDP